MPFLSDAIGQAKSQIQSQTRAAQNESTNNVRGAIARARNETVSTITSPVTSAINTGVSAVKGATASIFSGDISGAISQITDAPGQVAAKIAVFGNPNPAGPGGTMRVSRPGSSVAFGDALGGIEARGDPMLSFDWYAELPVIAPPNDSAYQCPWYFVEGANAPYRTFDTRSVFREGRVKHYAGNYSIDSLQLTFYLDVNNVASSYLKAWHSLILVPSTNDPKAVAGYGRPASYKKPIRLFFLSASRKTLAVFEYIECYPTTRAPLGLNSASDSLVGDVTFSTGDLYETYYKVDDSLATALTSQQNPMPFMSGVYSTSLSA